MNDIFLTSLSKNGFYFSDLIRWNLVCLNAKFRYIIIPLTVLNSPTCVYIPFQYIFLTNIEALKSRTNPQRIKPNTMCNENFPDLAIYSTVS